MNKYFYLLPMLSLPLQALTVETRATHGVFYAGLEKQVCLQIQVKADASEAGQKISALSFTTGKSSKKTDITKARLYKSTRNYFTLNTGDTNTKAYQVGEVSATSGSGTFNSPDITLTEGTNYLWLVYDIASNAKGSNKIDGVCTSVKVGGSEVKPVAKMGSNVKKRVYGTVYPFKYRVVPYYRTKWIMGWGAHTLTSNHFKSYTDIIHFAYSIDSSGAVVPQWDTHHGEGNAVGNQNNATALEFLKKTRGTAKSLIIAGIGHMDSGIASFYRSCSTREEMKAVARNIAKLLLDNGYDGVDIDWEYPGVSSGNTSQDWEYHTYLVADLREELAGASLSISIASSVGYKTPWHDVSDQLDYLNTMSYDDYADNHASMWLFQRDCRDLCQNTLKMPKVKIVGGLPFYTNRQRAIADQCGWNTVVSQHPNISPAANEAVLTVGNGSAVHSFKGPKQIKEKAKWAQDNGYGGVIIWASDNDVLKTHKMSLGKALFSVLKQTKR
jgi:hypothetical protein